MDRRFVLAIVLMMVVLLVPPLFFRRPPRQIPPRPAPSPTTAPATAPPAPVVDAPPGVASPLTANPSTTVVEDTVVVSSPLYRYRFSTRGGRMIGAELLTYKSMRRDEKGAVAQFISPESDFPALALLVGRDTVPLKNWRFVPSTKTLNASSSPVLTFTGARDSSLGLELRYSFRPDDYRIGVQGQVHGLGPNGGTLLVGLGPGLRNTESDSVEHARELAVVARDNGSRLTHFARLRPGEPATLNGPFQWIAVKSKYFVTALIAPDTTRGSLGRIAGAQAVATDRMHRTPERADVWASLTIGSSGAFGYDLYVGPMEYPRLKSIGHDFDDLNPYGWAWLRPIIRPVAIGARWLLVWLHEQLGLAYGLGLVVFGVLIRLVLWPLNQKAMRASMAMQAIQPVIKEIQEKHKNDPQRLQQEMFKVYKENKVNPFSGCWPLLLPWPVLIALFFVFQNSIELRGQPFLWIPDLSRPDPLYIIPVVMAVSMFGVTKIGQIGLPPNPQMKMMLYVMPIMMLVLFLNFAAGLNLYYSVQNLASIPQQWWVAKGRLKAALPPAPVPKAKVSKTGTR